MLIPFVLRLFGDIESLPHTDAYDAVVLHTLRAARAAHRAGAAFLLKCDDDTFVHVPRLLRFLRASSSASTFDSVASLGRPRPLYAGFQRGKTPPFARGAAYVVSHELIGVLAQRALESRAIAHALAQSSNTRTPAVPEDVVVGAWMREAIASARIKTAAMTATATTMQTQAQTQAAASAASGGGRRASSSASTASTSAAASLAALAAVAEARVCHEPRFEWCCCEVNHKLTLSCMMWRALSYSLSSLFSRLTDHIKLIASSSVARPTPSPRTTLRPIAWCACLSATRDA